MARRRVAQKRKVIPDPKFNDILVARFINCILDKGKKGLAESIFYKALESIEEKGKEEPLSVFRKAIANTAPLLEVRSRRVGGATYQVPVEVRESRRQALSMRWLIQNARSRPGRTMAEKLTGELMDAFNNAGGAVKKKEEVHRMAEANKAFAHYRW
jgi:small subunit ribosomal protein S7